MAGDDRVDKLIGIAKQLEGVSRHASTHAAGIVISREPLTEIMPLQKATNSDSLTSGLPKAMFSRTEPEKRNVSWKTKPIRLRRASRVRSRTSAPSTRMRPTDGS